MRVVINGKDTSIDEGKSVADLVGSLDLHGKIAVEINHKIIPRSQFDVHAIKEGDVIEIVHAIGGG